MSRMYEPDDGSYVQIGTGQDAGRTYRRSNLLAWGDDRRWFRLTGDNPHGIPVQGEPGLTWDEVLALGALGYIGSVRAR